MILAYRSARTTAYTAIDDARTAVSISRPRIASSRRRVPSRLFSASRTKPSTEARTETTAAR
jgi:hypothetical protein